MYCFNLWYQLKPCGELCVAMQSRYLEILDFTQFFDHFVFTPNAENVLEKELKIEIPVSVGNRTGSGGYVKKCRVYRIKITYHV